MTSGSTPRRSGWSSESWLLEKALGPISASAWRSTFLSESLMNAVGKGQTETVRVFLDAGADVNAKTQIGVTALTVATQAGHTEIVALLTAAGARKSEVIEPKAREERGRPLVRRGKPERDVDARDNLGQTALMRAASEGHTDTVLTLLEAGANVNAKTDHGMTALLNAVGEGQTETVRVLLDAGADVNAKTQIGVAALTVATQAGHTEIVELLKKAGAKE